MAVAAPRVLTPRRRRVGPLDASEQKTIGAALAVWLHRSGISRTSYRDDVRDMAEKVGREAARAFEATIATLDTSAPPDDGGP